MPDRIPFTKATIAGLPPADAGKRCWYRDSKIRGLYLMVTDRGARSFYAVRWFEGKTEQIRLGAFPDLSIEQARKKAEEVNASLAKGENPADRKRELKTDPTFGDLFNWWLGKFGQRRSESHRKDSERRFRLYLGHLNRVKASRITRADIRRLHEGIGLRAPIEANRVLALVRVVFNKAIAHEQIKCPNPAAGIEANEETERERRILPGEMVRFLEAVANEPIEAIRDYILLSLFTGARKSNVLAMRWEDLDLAGGVWRIPTTKNGRPQSVVLEPEETEILARRKTAAQEGSPWVFPAKTRSGHMSNPQHGWVRVLRSAGLKDLHLHDLRRTLGSCMADAGASEIVIGKALNHLTPQATRIYTRLSLNPIRQAKRRALDEMLAPREVEA